MERQLTKGIFPSSWKGATFTPLQKKKKIITELSDLRPLFLTPDLGKILERFVARMVLQDIKANLDLRQNSNIKGSSTSHDQENRQHSVN